MRGPSHPPKRSRMGRCGPKSCFFWYFPFLKTPIFKIASQSLALPRGHFMRGHWLNASMAKILLGKIDFRSSFFSFTDLFWCLVSLQTKFRQKFRQNSDKIQTTNFRQNSDKIQTTKFRQNSDNKIQTKTQTNFRPKFRQNSDKNLIQTRFRQQNSDKIQTKT